jgi:hypothetical protein
MKLDLQSLFGLHVHSYTLWMRPPPPRHPPLKGSYTRALLVSQDRRHLFVTPCSLLSVEQVHVPLAVVSRNQPGPGKSSYGIRWRRKVILPNLQRGFDEARCLKSSSGDRRFRLAVSRNWPDPGKSSYGLKNGGK